LRDLGKPRDRKRENAALKRLLAYVEAARRVPFLDGAVPASTSRHVGREEANKNLPRGDIWHDP
jgi:hypothetical protein